MPRNEEPVRYMERTRDYYRALGYEKDYVWAHHQDVPFTRLAKPLREFRIGLITTAHPPDKSNHDAKGVRHVWSGQVDPHAELNTDNLAWDRESTHTQDRESFLPIKALTQWAHEGLIGGLTARFHGAPTGYSQKKTNEVDAPEILARLREDGADAVFISAL
jgi:D-proline reductase (dithiol) PrdB